MQAHEAQEDNSRLQDSPVPHHGSTFVEEHPHGKYMHTKLSLYCIGMEKYV